MTLLLFYLSLSLIVSFLCSILESVLLSSTHSFLLAKEESGNKAATALINLKQNIDRPLSAILTLNTAAHTVGAAGVGAQATKLFGEAYFGIVSAILTMLILVFTEIIPKTLGARYWRELALTSGTIIKVLIIITFPLVKLSEYITRVISSKQLEQTTTREELSAMANLGAEEGIFEETENSIIQNLINFNSVKLYEIMTHRTNIVALAVNASLDEVSSFINQEKYSRIPVYEDNIDNIIGILHVKYLIQYLSEDGDKKEFNLRNIIRKPYFVAGFKRTDELFKELQLNKNHMAIIVDEYGGTAGIVTLEDLIEEIFGEIYDEDDEIENNIIQIDEKTFLINGSCSLDDVSDFLGIKLPTEEYETLSGFIIGSLGKIPQKEEEATIEFNGMVFKVEDYDEKKVSKIKVHKAL